MLVCPESPAWLVLKGLRQEATAVAEKLWGAEALIQLGSGECMHHSLGRHAPAACWGLQGTGGTARGRAERLPAAAPA